MSYSSSAHPQNNFGEQETFHCYQTHTQQSSCEHKSLTHGQADRNLALRHCHKNGHKIWKCLFMPNLEYALIYFMWILICNCMVYNIVDVLQMLSVFVIF